MDKSVVARVYQVVASRIEDIDELELHSISFSASPEARRVWEEEAERVLTEDEVDMLHALFLAQYMRAIGRA